MIPDDRASQTDASPRGAEQTLLAVIDGMLRELRPETILRPARLDDSIERDLGLDSLSRAELALRIERALDARVPERAALGARTPRELLAAIAGAPPGRGSMPLTHSPAARPTPVEGTPQSASTIVDAFRWHLEGHPDREHVTLLDGDDVLETMSYAQLWSAAGEVARGLAAAGIGGGDTVALMLPTGSAFLHAFLGAMRIGAVPVPMYPPLRWSEIEEHIRGRAAILANSLARMLITTPEAMFVGRVARAMLPSLESVASVDGLRTAGASVDALGLRGGDTAMLQYTSGSTGDPKGVILTHDNLLANIRAMGAAAAVTSRDRFVSWLPLYHDMGLIGAWLGTLYYAVPLVLMSPASFLARPARWLRAIHRYGATISAGPNFAYEMAASRVSDADLEGLDLSAWRLAFNGAEPVRAATLERFASRFARYGFDPRAMTTVYGLAESSVGLSFPPLGRNPRIDRIDPRALARDGVARPLGDSAQAAIEVVSCGLPLPAHEIRVVDERGRELAERIEGRIEFRGPSATHGYYRNAAATERLFRNGWLDTGDVGYITDGELFLTSRAKDLIKRGGHNIHPYDLESAVGDLPGIRKGCVAVFGTTDRASGTERVIVVAEAKPADPAARAALRDRIMALAEIHLSGPADEVLLVGAHTVLKTSSGKIRRAACRELYDSGLLEAPRHAVWRQLANLAATAVAGDLRRGALAIAATAYGVYAWLVALALALAIVPMIAVVGSARARYGIARAGARALLRRCAIALEIEGLEHWPAGKPAVVVANHASYLDGFVLIAALPAEVHFAAKREFARVPLIGFVLRRLGACFVERVDPAGGVEDTRELADVVHRGEAVAFFPEGTFSRRPGLAAFRLGAFAVSAATGAPVVPVVLRGTRSVLREHRWLPTRHAVRVELQPPLIPDGRDWSAAVRLRDRVREVMLRRCAEPDLAPRSSEL